MGSRSEGNGGVPFAVSQGRRDLQAAWEEKPEEVVTGPKGSPVAPF